MGIFSSRTSIKIENPGGRSAIGVNAFQIRISSVGDNIGPFFLYVNSLTNQ
jgi:hypothetical protein